MTNLEAEQLNTLLKKLASRLLQSVKTISYEELCTAIALLEELY